MKFLVEFAEDVQELVPLVIQLTHQLDTANSVDLILQYGSRVKGTYSLSSDLEFIAVTSGDKNISFKFMYKQREVNLWSISWDKTQEISQFDFYWVIPIGVFASGVPVYVKDAEIQKKYETLKQQIDGTDSYQEKLLDLANTKYQTLKEHIGTIALACQNEDLIEARFGLWEIIIASIDILGHLNGKYSIENWNENMDEVFSYKVLPGMYQELLTDSIAEDHLPLLLAYAIKLVGNIRIVLNTANIGRENEEVEVTNELAKDPWPIAYANKVIKAAEERNIFASAYAVHELQSYVMKEISKYKNERAKNSMFKLLGDSLQEYLDKGFPDFHRDITEQKFSSLIDDATKFKEKYIELYHQAGVPWFENTEEIKTYYKLA